MRNLLPGSACKAYAKKNFSPTNILCSSGKLFNGHNGENVCNFLTATGLPKHRRSPQISWDSSVGCGWVSVRSRVRSRIRVKSIVSAILAYMWWSAVFRQTPPQHTEHCSSKWTDHDECPIFLLDPALCDHRAVVVDLPVEWCEARPGAHRAQQVDIALVDVCGRSHTLHHGRVYATQHQPPGMTGHPICCRWRFDIEWKATFYIMHFFSTVF